MNDESAAMLSKYLNVDRSTNRRVNKCMTVLGQAAELIHQQNYFFALC